MSLPAAVHAVGVSKTFRSHATVRLLLSGKLRGDPVVALDGVSLDCARGEAIGVMGENGAGKSTLLRILAGLIEPSAGEVTVCGLDPRHAARALARKIGYVAADERGLTPHLSPREHLAFFAALHGYARIDALLHVDSLCERMGLATHAHRPLRELSTGMRRRTALARGLLGSPELLILDEPTRGVDPAGVVALHAHLRAALGGGTSMIIATHDPEEARALCVKVAVMAAARVIALEAPDRAAARLVGATLG